MKIILIGLRTKNHRNCFWAVKKLVYLVFCRNGIFLGAWWFVHGNIVLDLFV